MSERKSFIGGLILGGVVGFAIYKVLQIFREDRPSIRVRGGSIYFETSCGWTEARPDDEWMQDLPSPLPPVARFVVHIHKGGSTITHKGTQVHINEGPELRTLRIDNTGEPRLGPRNRLPKDPSGHQGVKDTSQNLDNVHVIPASPPVNLSAGDWIEIKYLSK